MDAEISKALMQRQRKLESRKCRKTVCITEDIHRDLISSKGDMQVQDFAEYIIKLGLTEYKKRRDQNERQKNRSNELHRIRDI